MTSIILVDSVTQAASEHSDVVLVSGSHGGLYAAQFAAGRGAVGAIFNDAGIGLDEAGVAGLRWLEQNGIAAAAVDHRTALIGDARATMSTGRVSVVNVLARRLGCELGMSAEESARRMAAEPGGFAPSMDRPALPQAASNLSIGRGELAVVAGIRLIGLDSASLIDDRDTDSIVVTGSHSALVGGEKASALKADALAAVFNDAGYQPGSPGVARIAALADRGIPAMAVSHATAHIGEARSSWITGRISEANEPAVRMGARAGLPLRKFLEEICVSGAVRRAANADRPGGPTRG